MSGQGVQDGDEQPSIARRVAAPRRVEELVQYCHPSNDELTLEGLRERIAGIPPGAVRGSIFFHLVCINEGVTLEMIKCLLEAFPEAARLDDDASWSPLHWACWNKNMDPRIVQLLLNRWPESVNRRNNKGHLPLHCLCDCGSVDETVLLTILNVLLEAVPDSATIAANNGALPIHLASQRGRSQPFCKRLIDAYPESLRVQSSVGYLPIHAACFAGNLSTVKYILETDPDSIDARDGCLPIHFAAAGESRGGCKIDIIRYLLAKDPDCASKRDVQGYRPFHLACEKTCLESVQLLFDAYPDAINIRDGRGRASINVAKERGNDAIAKFLGVQLTYARQAENIAAMHTPDENGWLPLHRALQNNVSLGAIRLLIKGNPSALRVAGNGLAFPLHIACEFSTAGVVEHLLECLDIHLHTLDLQKDSTLHYACRGGNLGVVKHLLEQGVPSVSEPNSSGKLPIHLLWESDRVDRDSVEYVDAVWRLLLAHPETVVH